MIQIYEVIEILISGEERLLSSYKISDKGCALADAWAVSRLGSITRVDYVEYRIGSYDSANRKTVWRSLGDK